MNEKSNLGRDLPKKDRMEWSNLWESIETKCHQGKDWMQMHAQLTDAVECSEVGTSTDTSSQADKVRRGPQEG